jgi:23S rRNA (uridine2552-2'-O)-methyltransferase
MTRPANPYKRADKFTQKAKEAGFKARSVFKLEEVQRRFRVFHQGQRIVDLGCFPGSWTQYALQQTGRNGRVVGVDLKAPALPSGVFLARSVYEVSADELEEALGGKAHVVLSDMAPNTTGVAFSDHVTQIELVRRALSLACALLLPGGTFLTKVFDGEEVPQLQAELRERFDKLRRVRPEAVRQNSREFFVLATGFKG